MRTSGISAPTLLLVVLLHAGGVGAQELALKRDLPALPANACEARGLTFEPASPPSPEAMADAERLASEASQAAILGEYDRARSLLSGAVALDRSSPSISYRYGRLLEDGGEHDAALTEYCRYLEIGTNPTEVADVESRVERIGIAMGLLGAGPARQAMEEGIAAFDVGDYDEAVRDFSRALVELPDWEQAHFNRAVAYLRSGRDAAGAADLEWYLELVPEAPDRIVVEGRLAALEPASEPTYNPSTTLVSGLIVPGMGYFYSGRPVLGALALGAAGASVGVGILYTEVEVNCRSPLVNGQCPPGEELPGGAEKRPLLIPGLAAAGAITILGAIHAYRGARAGGVQTALVESLEDLEELVPRLSLGGMTPNDGPTSELRVQPLVRDWTGGLRAELEVRF